MTTRGLWGGVEGRLSAPLLGVSITRLLQGQKSGPIHAMLEKLGSYTSRVPWLLLVRHL
jgi:hypothetical protein